MILTGKIIIINILVASLFVFKMTVLLFMEAYLIKKLNSTIGDFIWNVKKNENPIKNPLI